MKLNSKFKLFRRGAEGRISLRKYIDGKQRWIPFGTTDQREAESDCTKFLKWLDVYGYTEARAKLDGLHGPYVARQMVGEITFEQISELYLTYCKSIPAQHRPKEATQKACVAAVRRLMDWCDAPYVSDISPKQAYLGWQEKHPNQSEKTYAARYRQAQSVFSPAALKDYEEQGHRISNPFEGYKPPSNDVKPYRPISGALRAKIREGAGLSDHQKLIVLLALGAGLRRGEIMAAKLDWLGKDHIEVVSEEGGWTAKGGETAVIPLTKEFVDDLLKLRGKSDCPYLVPNDLEGDQRLKDEMAFVSKWLRNLGIKDRKPIHLLRKEFGCLVVMTHPQSIFAASKFLRHKSVTTTEKYYANLIKPVGFDPYKAIDAYAE